MSIVVPRTCTEVPFQGTGGQSDPQPLSEFRTRPAYVLLGDPGSGKTTAFEQECQALGGAAWMVSARDLITLDLDSHPEWQGKTLFIDGLDEMRAGASDSRSSLDEIRNRLDRLGKPRVRLSCREADWLGPNDRQSLSRVSPEGQITVLRLDPLTDQAAHELLIAQDIPGDVSEFVDEAERQGVATMLSNPLMLILLAKAVAQKDEWPQSRQETFELACREMASEQNSEHRAGAGATSIEAILDAAGWLCALALLTGTESYSRAPAENDNSSVALETLTAPPPQVPQENLAPAIATALFTGAGDQRFRPQHRHIAEFLGGRHLAQIIDHGLPARRAVALMTSHADGRVATVLRGLSAWLAAHSPEARRLLIDADPVGVGLYGDIGGFTTDEKRLLLQSLATAATQGPLLGHQWQDQRADGFQDNTAWAFRSLACSDTKEPIRDLITKQDADKPRERILEFVLDVLSKADAADLGSLADLQSDLETFLFDPENSPEVKESALDAYTHIAPASDAKTSKLLLLLNKVNEGLLSDPDDQLRGKLLIHLYPINLLPSHVWRYALHRNHSSLLGSFWIFWRFKLLEQSSKLEAGELLDALHDGGPELLAGLAQLECDELPLELLVRGLEELGESIEPTRRYDWLNTVGRSWEMHTASEESASRIRKWLEDRPAIQKDIYLTWLWRSNSDDHSTVHDFGRCDALHGSRSPADFGRWCLEKSIAISDAEPNVSKCLLRQAYYSLQSPNINKDLTLEIIQDQTRGHTTLAELLDELCQPHTPSEETKQLVHQHRDRMARFEEEERQRRDEWEAELRKRESELRDNRFPAPNLHTLARVYFGQIRGTSKEVSPELRISDFIGGDPKLVEATMIALREAVLRDDVPEAAETISLKSQSKLPYLAFPVLVSLELLHRDDPHRLDQLSDTQKRNSLTIYYCYPSPWEFDGSTGPHDCWLQQDPELVFDVLHQCAATALRAGEEHLPGLNDLNRIADLNTHAELVHKVRLKLLKALPTRAPSKQLSLLDRLLTKALQHPDPRATRSVDPRQVSQVEPKRRATGSLVDDRRIYLSQPIPTPAMGVCGSEQGTSSISAEFLHSSSDHPGMGDSILSACSDPAMLRDTIKLLGSSYGPLDLSEPGIVTVDIGISRRISSLIAQLGSIASEEAHQALISLVEDPELAAWHEQLTYLWERQCVLLRNASYNTPSIKQVQQTLNDQTPASAADLAALLEDRLRDIASEVRGSNSNLWRQFWNEDSYGNPTDQKSENSCRDVLLEALKSRLPKTVDAAPEGRYVADKRADIRASHGGFNVPIEIKKNSHRDLWTALRSQLIGQYTTDPTTSGHGVYLVLWFGANETWKHPDRTRPTTPDELRMQLEGDLTREEACKISVVVLDVTKPE